jgi:hypothetical protein
MTRLDDLLAEILCLLSIDRAKVSLMTENQVKTAIANYILEEYQAK